MERIGARLPVDGNIHLFLAVNENHVRLDFAGVFGAADSFGGAEPIPLNSAGDAILPGIYVFSLPDAPGGTGTPTGAGG